MTRRIVVVTGGAGGIGRAVAGAFADHEDDVFIVDCDPAGVEVAAAIDGSVFVECDVTSEEQVETATARIGEMSGRIDVLVNIAGGFPAQRGVEETTIEEWHAIVELNLTSVFLMTRACIPLLRRSASGRVINIGSLAAQLAGYRTSPPYVAAKAGVHALTRVLATELAPDGVTVNTLAPSAVMTERILALRDEEERKATAGSIPLGRYQTPEELSAWVIFLASADSGFMTGQTVSVNGGRFMT